MIIRKIGGRRQGRRRGDRRLRGPGHWPGWSSSTLRDGMRRSRDDPPTTRRPPADNLPTTRRPPAEDPTMTDDRERPNDPDAPTLHPPASAPHHRSRWRAPTDAGRGTAGRRDPVPSTSASASPAGPACRLRRRAPRRNHRPPRPASSAGVIGQTGTVEIAGEGFRITLPDGWREIDRTIDRGEVDPFPPTRYRPAAPAGRQLAAAGEAFAVTCARICLGRRGPNVNVIVQPRPEGCRRTPGTSRRRSWRRSTRCRA
jgi:hypothetical protein